MKTKIQISTSILFLVISIISTHLSAAVKSGENAEIIPLDKMQAGAQGMIGLGGHSEFHFAGTFDKAFTESSQARGVLGMGKYGLIAGASYKWTPFPDFENQPAIAFKGGVQVYRIEKSSVFDIYFEPIFSKKYPTEHGLFIPYIAIPIGVSYYEDESVTPIQFVVGSTYYNYGAELGLEMQNSESYILLYWNYLFDEIKGIH